MGSLKDYISTREAAERYGLAQEHFALLAKSRKIKATKIARDWLLYLPSLEYYMTHRPKRGPKPRVARSRHT